MARVCQILHNADGNIQGTGNYRAWEDHTEYEVGFCDGSTSKVTVDIIAEKCCLGLTQRGGTLSYLSKSVITGRNGIQY